MDRLRAVLQRLLRPHGALIAALSLLSAAGLVLVFLRGWENTLLAYCLYPLSAYCAGVLSVGAVQLFRRVRQRLHENSHYRRYATDLHFRAEISLYFSLAVTFAFSTYKAAAGILYRSAWLGAIAGYYILLAVMRWLLLKRIRSGNTGGTFRVCGVLLLVLTGALGAISFYTIYRNNTVHYPGFMIYAAAAFTFYSLSMAIWNLVRYRKLQVAVYTASKILALASSLVSLFFLQTAMFAAFGDGASWERQLNLLTGGTVHATILVLACLLLRGPKKA